jgi:hypothetical protein
MHCRLYGVDGALKLLDHDHKGEEQYVDLGLGRIYRRWRKDGYSWSRDFLIPKAYGGGAKVNVHLDQRGEVRRRNDFRRTIYLCV